MGGNLAVVVRRNGEVLPMQRWTNTLPWFVNHLGLIEQWPEHFDEWMESYRKMESDWKAHRKTYEKLARRFGRNSIPLDKDPFEHNMTAVYAPYPWRKVPSEYGIVVIDYDQKVVLSHQYYTSLGELLPGDVTAYATWPKADETPVAPFLAKVLCQSVTDDTRIPDLHAAGRLVAISGIKMNGEEREAVVEPLEGVSLNRIANMAKSVYKHRPSGIFWQSILIDMRPWTVKDFRQKETSEEMLALKDRMKELGFSFSRQEETEYNKYAKRLSRA